MKKTTFFLILIVLLFSTKNSFSQYFLKENPVVFTTDEITENNIAKVIGDLQKTFSTEELLLVKKNIAQHNKLIQAQMDHVKKMRQSVIDQQLVLTEQQSISSLLNLKNDHITKYDEISKSIEFNLQKISRRGMYLFIKKNVNPFKESSSDLAKEASKNTTPFAIKTLRGSFIKSVTDVYKNDSFNSNLYQYINEEVSGELKSVKDLNENDLAKKIYWNIAIVDVLPLKESLQSRKTKFSNKDNKNITLINIDNGVTSKLKSKLSNSGLPTNQINKILTFIRENSRNINSQNTRSNQIQVKLITDGQSKLKTLSDKIDIVDKKVEESHSFFKEFLLQNCKIEYVKEQPEKSIILGKKYLLDKIKDSYAVELYLQENVLKEKWDEELIIRESVTSEVAKSVIDLVQQLNSSYGTIEQHRQIKELVNDEFTSETANKRSFSGEVDKVWLFLEITSNGAKVNLVSKFNFFSEEKSSLKKEAFLEDAKSHFLLDKATLTLLSKMNSETDITPTTPNNTSLNDKLIKIPKVPKKEIKKGKSNETLDIDANNLKKVLDNETNGKSASQKKIEDDISRKMRENDAEIKNRKFAALQNQELEKDVKKYKRKRGFQRTLMFLSAAAGGYFLYDSTVVARSKYNEATNATDATTYRDNVELSKKIAYGFFGLATYNFICATRYKIKKKKAMKIKLNAGFSFNNRLKGVGLICSF